MSNDNKVTWGQANDPNTWSHTTDSHSYTMNNTVNQTLNSVQITNSAMKNHNIVFHGPNGKEVGRFDFNGEEMKFDGQADVSAQVFIEWARKTFTDRVLEDKRSVLKEVMDALVHESTGALYEDAEKLAILTCIQRVQEIQRSVEPAQAEMNYSVNLAKSMAATKNAVATSIIGSAFGGQP
jgi:hypothetical protein